jgi:hypothetical protein
LAVAIILKAFCPFAAEGVCANAVLERVIAENTYKQTKNTYDIHGNILTVKTCAYTTGRTESNLLAATYSYDTQKRLTGITYNGMVALANATITSYDTIGNPCTYKE